MWLSPVSWKTSLPIGIVVSMACWSKYRPRRTLRGIGLCVGEREEVVTHS
jgi:hypothetical protein